MTHASKSWSLFRRLAVLALLGGLLLAATAPAFAQKGKPKAPAPPPPDGTIYIARANSTNGLSVWGMKTDGSGLTMVLPNSFFYLNGGEYFLATTPSDRVYGSDPLHDRWWLTYGITGYYDEWRATNGSVYYNLEHRDLFAVRTSPADRTQLEVVQLTDLFGYLTLATIGGAWSTVPHWSNDSNEEPDSYIVHDYVQDLRNVFYVDEDGRAIIDRSLGSTPVRQLRLPFAGSDIELGSQTGDFIPFGPDLLDHEYLVIALDEMLWPYLHTNGLWGIRSGMTSPDGTMYVKHSGSQYFIQDALGSQLQSLGSPGTGQGHNMFPEWSRDGATVMLVDGTSSTDGATSSAGNIYLQSPYGGSATPLLLAGSTRKGKVTTATSYFHSKWSPDSQHLITRRYTHTNGTKSGEGLVRVSVADGSVTDLKVDTTTWHIPLRWVSNQIAP